MEKKIYIYIYIFIYICCVILLAPFITTKHQPYTSRFITHQKKRFSNIWYWQCVRLWLKLSSQFRNSKKPASRGTLSYLQVLYMKILLFGEIRQLKSRSLNKTYPSQLKSRSLNKTYPSISSWEPKQKFGVQFKFLIIFIRTFGLKISCSI